jgi:hypothetical protein
MPGVPEGAWTAHPSYGHPPVLLTAENTTGALACWIRARGAIRAEDLGGGGYAVYAIDGPGGRATVPSPWDLPPVERPRLWGMLRPTAAALRAWESEEGCTGAWVLMGGKAELHPFPGARGGRPETTGTACAGECGKGCPLAHVAPGRAYLDDKADGTALVSHGWDVARVTAGGSGGARMGERELRVGPTPGDPMVVGPGADLVLGAPPPTVLVQSTGHGVASMLLARHPLGAWPGGGADLRAAAAARGIFAYLGISAEAERGATCCQPSGPPRHGGRQ